MPEAAGIEPRNENQIAEFNEFEFKLEAFKKKYDGVVYDLDDPDQDKQARSDRLSVGKVIASLDRKHKELKAPLKEKVDLIDGERKRIKDDLLNVQGKIKGQIEAHEQKIAEHAEMLGNKVQAIYDLGEFGEFEKPDSESLKARLCALKEIEIDDSYEFRKADATLAEVETVKKLSTMLAEVMKQEAEQAELERLRKEKEERERADREEKIRQEAAAKAKLDAENKAKAEQERAEQEKTAAIKAQQEAEQRAKFAAENAERQAREAAEQAAQKERARIEREHKEALAREAAKTKAEEAKKAKQAHRAKIHKQAKDCFIKEGYSDKEASKIVTLIKDGLIKNIVIEY